MQQLLAAFGIDWRLLVIQGINFLVLLVVLTYFLYRPLMNIIDERRKKIEEGVRKAEEADRNLLAAKEEGEGIVGEAAKEAEGLVAAARTRAGDLSMQSQKAAQEKADAILKDAQARADEESRQTMLESEREIARAAMLAAEKILKKNA